MPNHPPFNMRTASSVSTILDWARRNARITWAVGGDTDRLLTGVARSVGDEHGNFAGSDDDVRDLYLRVSATFEHFLPIPEVIDLLEQGLIFEDA